MEKIKTGVQGLDEILAGGFPANRLYIVDGNPGSGKTTLALQFLMEGRSRGETGLYITLSESKDELTESAKTHGWNLDGLEIFELPTIEQLNTDAQNSFFYTSEIELGATNEAMLKKIEDIKPKRVVIDSLSELKLLTQDPVKFRRLMMSLKSYFLRQRATVILLDDKTANHAGMELQSIVHGVLSLEQLAPEYGTERRRLRVSKLRGVAYRGGYHDFSIRTGGIIVFPRLVANEHGIETAEEMISSGVKGIDALLGGGVELGSSTLIMGPAGAGKSTLSIQYAVKAASQGQKAAVFTFDEGKKSIITRCRGIGVDLDPLLENKTLLLRQIDPAELSPGEFMHMVRECVDVEKTKVVVIDSLNGYLNAMPEERFLVIQMHELLSYLSQMGVVTFMVVAQHGLIGSTMESAVDVSYLADTVILLRYFEAQGEVKRAISVLKRRAGPHERTIREFMISSKGLEVGEPFLKFQGVLTGMPQILGNQNGRLEL
jgi:circadian clock protein KaiC